MKKILYLVILSLAVSVLNIPELVAQNAQKIEITLKGGKKVKLGEGLYYIGYRTIERTEIVAANGDRCLIVNCKGKGVNEAPDMSFFMLNNTDDITSEVFSKVVDRIKQAIDTGITHGEINDVEGYRFVWNGGSKKLDEKSGKLGYDYKIEVINVK